MIGFAGPIPGLHTVESVTWIISYCYEVGFVSGLVERHANDTCFVWYEQAVVSHAPFVPAGRFDLSLNIVIGADFTFSCQRGKRFGNTVKAVLFDAGDSLDDGKHFGAVLLGLNDICRVVTGV